MTEDDVRQLIRDECKRIGIAAFTRKAGMTRQHTYAVLNGRRSPRLGVLDAVGVEAVTVYRRKNSADQLPSSGK